MGDTRSKILSERCDGTVDVTWPCPQKKGHEGAHGMGEPFVMPRMTDGRSPHSFAAHLEEDHCRCGRPAAHKVEDTSGPSGFHPMTNYLCCEHFSEWVGDCGYYPWDYDARA